MLDFGFYNMDCMEGMKGFPDGYFDLAVVDPPYGNPAGEGFKGSGKSRFGERFNKYIKEPANHASGGALEKYETDKKEQNLLSGGGWFARYNDDDSAKSNSVEWDIAPDEDYFTELFRVSKEQVIWGGNYFCLPPTRCFLVWYKVNFSEKFSMAMAEYAWCSIQGNAKLFKSQSSGMKGRFHPTQKPVELYQWVLGMFGEKGMTFLDTHVGSASSLIAAHDAGMEYVGFEINEDYYRKAKKRLDNHTAQMNLFNFAEYGEDSPE